MIGRIDGSNTGNEARSRGFTLTCWVGEVCSSQARRDLCDTRDRNATYLRRIDSELISLQALSRNSWTLRYSE